MTVLSVPPPDAGPALAERPHKRRGERPAVRRGGLPATRDLEPTLWGLLTLAGGEIAVMALAPARGAAVAAVAAACLTLASAAAVLRAILTLSPAMPRPVRAAVVGRSASALDLRRELERAGVRDVLVIGAIVPGPVRAKARDALELGAVSDVGRIVGERSLDLLLLGPGASRVEAVDAVMRFCDGDPVRLCDLSAFYEDVFGRVPVAEIDGAWERYLLHPRFRERRTQRALDVLVAGAAAVVLLPLLAMLVLLIRRDGGPALFRQRRIGQHGRPFMILKLRTMRWEGADEPARWSSGDDPRVTPMGRTLRRTHLDELPQLLNVLRGEMTLVGPRPEQPEIAARLEELMPFWRGRHRHKPGLTGWAQIRCGYAGSDDDSAWKLAHDLFYLRHRSLALDVAILVRTASMLLRGPRRAEHLEAPSPAPRLTAARERPLARVPPPRALVTGGAGFIGSHLVDALLDDGYEVVAVDDLSGGHEANLAAALARGASLVEADVTVARAMRRCLEHARPEVVFHLAAQIDVAYAIGEPVYDSAVNVIGTVAVLDAARACGARRFVLASTGGAIYGEAAAIPTPEHAPVAPLSPYGAAKAAAEHYTALYGRLHGLSTVSLRMANVYGPRQGASGEGGVIARFCRARVAGMAVPVFGDGRQTRDFVYVGDVVAAFAAAGRSDVAGVLNVGTGTETSVLELVDRLGLGLDFRAGRAGEVRRSALDAAAAARLLGWRARTPLAEGLAATLAFGQGLREDAPIAV